MSFHTGLHQIRIFIAHSLPQEDKGTISGPIISHLAQDPSLSSVFQETIQSQACPICSYGKDLGEFGLVLIEQTDATRSIKKASLNLSLSFKDGKLVHFKKKRST